VCWLLALTLALTVVPAGSAAVPKACSLLTSKQVTSVLGSDVLPRTADGNRLWQMCRWQGEALVPNRPCYRQVTLMVSRTSKAGFLQLRNQNLYAQPVRGAGRLAYSAENRGLFAVWQDGLQLEVVVSNVPSPLTTAKRVAIAALANL
jgi:hypothetical protein